MRRGTIPFDMVISVMILDTDPVLERLECWR